MKKRRIKNFTFLVLMTISTGKLNLLNLILIT